MAPGTGGTGAYRLGEGDIEEFPFGHAEFETLVISVAYSGLKPGRKSRPEMIVWSPQHTGGQWISGRDEKKASGPHNV